VWEVPTTIIVGREKHPTSRMHTKLTLIWTPIDAQFVLECVIAIKDKARVTCGFLIFLLCGL
jgi:hypothetical protein